MLFLGYNKGEDVRRRFAKIHSAVKETLWTLFPIVEVVMTTITKLPLCGIRLNPYVRQSRTHGGFSVRFFFLKVGE